MKLFMMMLIAALTMAMGLTVAPQNVVETAITTDDFDDSGYDGAWETVDALDVEIFLPDGWTGEDATGEYECYRAQSADGEVTLTILYPVDGAPAGEVVTAGGKEARLVRGDDGSLTVTMALSEDRIVAFRFDRASEDALSEDVALQIAGSCTDVW